MVFVLLPISLSLKLHCCRFPTRTIPYTKKKRFDLFFPSKRSKSYQLTFFTSFLTIVLLPSSFFPSSSFLLFLLLLLLLFFFLPSLSPFYGLRP